MTDIDPKASKLANGTSKRFLFNVPSFTRCKNPISGGNIPARIKTGYFPEKAIVRKKIVGDEVATNSEGRVIMVPSFILIFKLNFSSRISLILFPKISLNDDINAKYPPSIVVRIAVTDRERRGNLTIPGVLNRIATGSIELIAPAGIKAVASADQPTINPIVKTHEDVRRVALVINFNQVPDANVRSRSQRIWSH